MATKRTFQITNHAPKVWLVGRSLPDPSQIEEFMAYRDRFWNFANADEAQVASAGCSPQTLIELGGKVCYDSFHNPGNKTSQEYIHGSVIEHEHGSVLEHIALNFMVASLPRSTQLELVRHRAGMAYSFRSTRFTDSWLEFVVPPLLRLEQHAQERQIFIDYSRKSFQVYSDIADAIDSDTQGDATLRRKRIKEAARSVLPNSLGSDGLVTCNGRSLRHLIAMRTDPHADASIREFAYGLYLASVDTVPALFVDAEVIPQSFGTPHIKFAHPKV